LGASLGVVWILGSTLCAVNHRYISNLPTHKRYVLRLLVN
jgi:hypothetical protein